MRARPGCGPGATASNSLGGVIDEAAMWRQFASLLPPAAAEEVMDCWDIGEQEAGLDLLIAGLLAHQVLISETMRAEIAVAAEVWGVWTRLAPGIGRCLGSRKGDASLRLIENTGTAPLPGSSAGTGTAPADLLVAPWIACDRCGRVLARAHRREPWGELSYLAEHYVLFTPGQSTAARLFDPDSVWDALIALRTSCDR